jgi:hypothetical protein
MRWLQNDGRRYAFSLHPRTHDFFIGTGASFIPSLLYIRQKPLPLVVPSAVVSSALFLGILGFPRQDSQGDLRGN